MPSDDLSARYTHLLEVVQRTRQALHRQDFDSLPALLEEQASLLQALQHTPLSPEHTTTIEIVYETLLTTMHEAAQQQAAIQEQLHALGSRKKPLAAYIHAQYQ